MKHTAGPWKAFGSTVYAGETMVATAECEAFRDISGYDDAPQTPDSPGELNEYDHPTHGAGVEESWANARLIAAAPELYAALRELLEASEEQDGTMKTFPRLQRAESRARVALAEASD